MVGDQGLSRISKTSVQSNNNRSDRCRSALVSALSDLKSIAARLHYRKQRRKTVEWGKTVDHDPTPCTQYTRYDHIEA